tara:strand:+ start:368 stop:928 length:561 start_codon:yes stop_codon:yes gene_type:complete
MRKRNFWSQIFSAMNGAITFGKISPKGDVTSSVHIQALDGRHFMSFDEDGPRTGYTLLNSPGSTFIHSGEDLTKEQEGIMILAKNGDIHIKANNGKIKLEALDIELIANGNAPHGVLWANANETLKLDSKNVTIDGKQSCKVMTSGLLTLRGSLGTQLLTPLLEGVSRALTKDKLPEPGETNTKSI